MANKIAPDADRSREQIEAQLLQGVAAPLARQRVRLSYVAALVLVGLSMLLLPLLYMGLLFLLGHTSWWMFQYASYLGLQRGSIWLFAISLLGGVTVLFLLKPLFRRNGNDSREVRLKRESEPFLFEYIESLCAAVNAPAPTSIRIDCRDNASAGMRRGFLSLFRNDLTVTIGLPLIACLTARQLTGVLAHEFGHFAQSYGMRFGATARLLNYWFIRAAYEKDEWDLWLHVMASQTNGYIWLIVKVLQGMVALSRQLLAALAMIGSAISCYLLRQQEYDADSYEYRVAGSATFAETSLLLSRIHLATLKAQANIETFYREARLPDNFAMLVVSNLKHISPEEDQALQEHFEQEKTGWFVSHPPTRLRIAAAESAAVVGSLEFSDELNQLPASELFRNYTRIAENITVRNYKQVLGKSFDKHSLRKTSRLIKERDDEVEARLAINRFFQAEVPPLRPLRIDVGNETMASDLADIMRLLRQARKKMLAGAKRYDKLAECWKNAKVSSEMAVEALTLAEAKLNFQPDQFRLTSTRPADVKKRVKQTQESVRKLGLQMIGFEDEAEYRLSLALQLLQSEEIISRIERGQALQNKILPLIPPARLTGKLMGQILDVWLTAKRISTLLDTITGRWVSDAKKRTAIELVIKQLEKVHFILTGMQSKLAKEPYPFSQSADLRTMADFVIPEIPEPDNLWGLLFAIQMTCERLPELQTRLFGKLVHAAEKVEQAIGLTPLPLPEKPAPSKRATSQATAEGIA